MIRKWTAGRAVSSLHQNVKCSVAGEAIFSIACYDQDKIIYL